MEIFEIYQVVLFFGLLFAKGAVSGRLLYGCVFIGLGIWLALFVLQGVGMYKMVKNRSLKNKWLAFVPFVNIWYMGKLAGTCNIFGRKMKRAGLYTMLAQILAVVVCAATVAAEIMQSAVAGSDGLRHVRSQLLLFQRFHRFHCPARLHHHALYPPDGALQEILRAGIPAHLLAGAVSSRFEIRRGVRASE